MTLPLERHNVLQRDRINHALDDITKYPLSVVTAPSGYGKTHAAKLFFDSTKKACLWITIYRQFDVYSFWNKFFEQLCKNNGTITDYSKAYNALADKRFIVKTIDELTAAGFEEKTYLVIDDFHNLDNEDVLEFVKQVVKCNIDNFHMVLLTRKRPSKLLNELPTHYEEVGIDDLRMNKQEIVEYSHILDTNLSFNQIEQVYKMSNGWFAAAYILINGLKKGIDITYSNYQIEGLIKGAIYDELDIEVKNFLINLSFLEHFSIPQAIYILDDEQAENIIYELYSSSSILNYDRTINEYVIHDVLRKFLSIEGRKNFFDLTPYYKRAGEWALKNEMLPDAIKYYHLSNDMYAFLQQLESIVHIDKYCVLSDAACRVFKDFGKEDYAKYPYSFIEIGLVMEMQRKNKIQVQGFWILYTMYRMALKDDTAFGEFNDYVLGETILLGFLFHYNNIKKMSDCTRDARKYFDGLKSKKITRKSEIPFNFVHILYMLCVNKGHLKEDKDSSISWVQDLAFVTDGCGRGADWAINAEYDFLTGNMEKVETNALKGMYKASTAQQLFVEIISAFVLLRLYIYQGKKREFAACLDDIHNRIKKNGNIMYNLPIEMIEGYCYSTLGWNDKTPQWSTDDTMFFEELSIESAGFISIIQTRLLISKGEYHLAEVQTEITKRHSARYKSLLGDISNTVLLAIAQDKQGQHVKAKKHIQKAIKMSISDNIVMPLAENAEYILDILIEINNETESRFVKELITHCRKYMKGLKAFREDSMLTSREIQVLQLTSQGYGRNEIADSLNVSVNTIKKHLAAIYRKLGCNNKIEAIYKAKDLNII